MAKLSPKKITLSAINGGNEYTIGDGVQPNAINDTINASAYAQALATNTPDVSQANNVGVPSVSIIEEYDGTPRLSFANLKGEKGDSGVGNAKLSNTYGESDTDGYTQKATNSLVCNPNLLINGDFRINQRGQTSYTTTRTILYSADRWRISSNEGSNITFNIETKVLSNTGNYTGYFMQVIEDTNSLWNRTVTISAKVDGNIVSKAIKFPSKPTSNSGVGDALIAVSDKCQIRLYYYASSQKVGFTFDIFPNSSVTIEFAKLEIGSVATAFSPRPYAEEFAMCQRYYKRIVPNAENSIAVGTMQPATTNAGFAVFNFGIPMQKAPTISYSSLSDLAIGYNDTSTGQTTITSMGYANTDRSLTTYKSYVTGTGFTQGQFTYFVVKPNGYIEFDAEIY